MRRLSATIALMCVALLLAGAATSAQDKDKEVVLKGSITCAKCDLKVEGQKGCATVIVVKDKDKSTIFYFDKAGHKKHHSGVCQTPKNGSVTGTVAEDEKSKKKIVTVKTVTFD